MTTAVRRLLADIADGFHAGLDVLLWGQPYPRRLDPTTLAWLTKGRRRA